MEVIDLNIVDPTQFDQDSKYFDPKSKTDNPRWDCVKVKYKSKSNKILSLPELKILFNEDELLVVKKGNRLSILPVRNNIATILLETI
jgi:predicted RNA-binding protein with PUA-like domain